MVVSSAAVEDGERLLLVSSGGGVLLDLLALEGWWSDHDRTWLVVDGPDTRDALAGEDVRHAAELGPRQVLRIPAAVVASWCLLGREQVGCVLTAGSGVAVPVFVAARLRGIPCLWLETRNVLTGPGLAARVGGALASAVLVQHRRLLGRHRRAVHVGELY